METAGRKIGKVHKKAGKTAVRRKRVKGSTERGRTVATKGAVKKSKEQEKFTVLNVVNSVFLPVLKIDHYARKKRTYEHFPIKVKKCMLFNLSSCILLLGKPKRTSYGHEVFCHQHTCTKCVSCLNKSKVPSSIQSLY
jgi:TPP-dependent indolepyruvate ferredoxin oxidoreductase alpha subunit